ncbi:MAG: hypothetical protein MK082_04060 [Phycisphaerales bacterium]|nr:hypothetical protein [Phycisphaerales bacterium]
MNDLHHGMQDGGGESSGLWKRACSFGESLRIRCGASRRQFAVFALLTMVAATLWARPAGLLIWHRLRIITGMPRMAIANEDPKLVAEAGGERPEALDAGRPVRLDVDLRRDPFLQPGSVRTVVLLDDGDRGVLDVPESPEPAFLQMVPIVETIRLSGTAKGLGTAVLDGRARLLGSRFEKDGLTFTLREVRSSAVLLDVSRPDAEEVFTFILDRGGARILAEE